MKLGRPRRRMRELSLHQFLPNVVTVLALCSGLTAIRFAVQEKWEWAVGAVVVAAVLDTLDGRLARRMGVTTKFGAELDSLSDFLCFGVAPALIVYLWSLHAAGGFGWALCLLFAVAAALRLARFNARLGTSDLPSWAGSFFTGVPAPAGAGAALLPMMLYFQFGNDLLRHPVVNLFVLVSVGGLMVSRLPTLSFKQIKVPHRWVLPGLMGIGLLVALIVIQTWAILSIMMLVYLSTFPIAILQYRKLQAAGLHAPSADGDYADDAEERAFEPLAELETDVEQAGAAPESEGGNTTVDRPTPHLTARNEALRCIV